METSLLTAIGEEIAAGDDNDLRGVLIHPARLTATASSSNDIASYSDPQVVVNGAGLVGSVHTYNGGSWVSAVDDHVGAWLSVDLGGVYTLSKVKIFSPSFIASWGVTSQPVKAEYSSEK